MQVAKSESSPEYAVKRRAPVSRGIRGLTTEESVIVEQAREILARRFRHGNVFDGPKAVRDYLSTLHAENAAEHEVFGILFLDAQHRLIENQMMFRGSLTQTSVYPREVVKAALALNAAAVILHHNHPTGFAEPSRADELLTHSLKVALALIDVRVLDHFVVGENIVSFAERGLL